MDKKKYLDYTGLSSVVDNLKSILNSHTSNNKIHVPANGASGQILKIDSDGNIVWGNSSAGGTSDIGYNDNQPTTGLYADMTWIGD